MNEPRTNEPRTFDKNTLADWTIMLYIAADGVLANFGVESLKQVNRSFLTTLPDEKATVVVTAQFSIDAPGGQSIKRYIFDKRSTKNLSESSAAPLVAGPNMSEKGALEDFLGWAYKNSQSKYYALILWSHGPELFLQPPPGGNNGNSASAQLYLTLPDLSAALRDTLAGRKLDIVGFDACSMSMFEMAYELKGLAKLMVSSQEEVPDASFPYYDLVKLFQVRGKDLGSLLETFDSPRQEGVQDEGRVKSLQSAHKDIKEGIEQYVVEYLGTYQDYIFGQSTGLNRVTLSVLNLAEGEALKEAVRSLACALLAEKDNPEFLDRLIKARKDSQDYAGGLYVDFHEFCTKLLGQLVETKKWEDIKNACKNVLTLLGPSQDSFILVNGSVTGEGTISTTNTADTRSHGISIYLPYIPDEEDDHKVNRPLVEVKGGRGTLGGKLSEVLNGTAAEYLMSARQDLIRYTESYYEKLKLAKKTAWYSFITDQWTRALIENRCNRDNPDFHYSARQSAINLSRKRIDTAEGCKPETSAGLGGSPVDAG